MAKPTLKSVGKLENGKAVEVKLSDEEMKKFRAFLDSNAICLRKSADAIKRIDGILPDIPFRQRKYAASCEVVSAMLSLMLNKEIEMDV